MRWHVMCMCLGGKPDRRTFREFPAAIWTGECVFQPATLPGACRSGTVLRPASRHLADWTHPGKTGAGFRLATLTNCAYAVSEAQLINARLDDLLEQMLSAETVRRLKPGPEPYLMAAERLGVSKAEICLVTAHAWDTAGPLHAGLAAAFVARQGPVLDRSDLQPAFVEPDLQGLAERIIAAR